MTMSMTIKSGFSPGQRLVGGIHALRLVAGVRQGVTDHLPGVPLVVHDQYGLAHVGPILSQSARPLLEETLSFPRRSLEPGRV
jgi:hypothetical protein